MGSLCLEFGLERGVKLFPKSGQHIVVVESLKLPPQLPNGRHAPRNTRAFSPVKNELTGKVLDGPFRSDAATPYRRTVGGSREPGDSPRPRRYPLVHRDFIRLIGIVELAQPFFHARGSELSRLEETLERGEHADLKGGIELGEFRSRELLLDERDSQLLGVVNLSRLGMICHTTTPPLTPILGLR